MTDPKPGDPLYLRSMEAAYRRSFESKVSATPPDGVILEATLFYAVGGGQESDTGTLTPAGGHPVKVVEVRRKGASTVHRLERSGLSSFHKGDAVTGTIDWERRHRHMRLHTAQHLLSALAFERHQLRTRDAAMSGRGGFLEIEGSLDAAALAQLETEANESYFQKSVPVDLEFVSRADFEARPGRSSAKGLPPGLTEIRLIVIDGIDSCPCGGTHVKDTKEVGGVRLLSPQSAPGGGQRLPFELLPDGDTDQNAVR